MKGFIKLITAIAIFTIGFVIGALWTIRQIAKSDKETEEDGEEQPGSVPPMGANQPTETSADSQSKPEVAEPASETIVFVTEQGAKYHRANCQTLGEHKIAIPLESAKEKYTPCAICNPP